MTDTGVVAILKAKIAAAILLLLMVVVGLTGLQYLRHKKPDQELRLEISAN